jgi:AraC family transcriptional regulator
MTTRTATIQKIEQAIQFIGECVEMDKIPNLSEMAKASGLSKYHFHRVYRLVTGETCSQTIARLRLVRGMSALQQSSTSITDAAFESGFSSSQAFAKAIQKHLNTTATELRQQPERLARTVNHLTRLKGDEHNGEHVLSVEIASLDPFEVVAVRTDGLYPNVADTYVKLFHEVGGPDNVRAILGRSFGDSETGLSGQIRFDCELKLRSDSGSLPAGAHRSKITGGDYLVARHIGSYKHLEETIDPLYRLITTSHQLEFSDSHNVFHYVDDPGETSEAELRTDIYLPVEFV